MDIKKIFNPKSKGHNWGAATAFFGGLMAFLPQVKEFIPEESYGYILMIVGVVTIYIRSVTTQPVDEK